MTIVPVVLTICGVAVLLLAERGEAGWRLPVKALSSTGFVATALAAGATDSGYGGWVLVALCLGWIGDVSLVPPGRRWFLTGLAAFLLSHIAYVGAFAVSGIDAMWIPVAALGIGAAAGFVGRWLWPHLPTPMRVPVVAYITIISVMLAAAIGAATAGAPWPVLPAAAAFYLSDLAVARQRFVAPGFVNRAWGLPLYYGAQILFALSTGMV
jgi:uncharacterized membrane protein YhhN